MESGDGVIEKSLSLPLASTVPLFESMMEQIYLPRFEKVTLKKRRLDRVQKTDLLPAVVQPKANGGAPPKKMGVDFRR